MDGDTILHPQFIERAAAVADASPDTAGVSAAWRGKPQRGRTIWQRLVLLYQRIGYGRAAENRLRRNVHTMSGAGSFYRAEALNGLIRHRGEVFAGRPDNLVEDYETTLALKQLGWKVTANQQCIAYTDLLPTLRELGAQQIRWTRGTLDEWRRYGWCRATRLSIASALVTVTTLAYAGVWVLSDIAGFLAHGDAPNPRYFLPAGCVALYQAWAVKHLGWKIMLFEVALLPELAFNVIRGYWLARSVASSCLRRDRGLWA